MDNGAEAASQSRPRTSRWAALIYLSGPLAIYGLLWLTTSPFVYRQPGWSGQVFRSGMEQILAGHINLESSIFVLCGFGSGFLELNTWGILGLCLLLVGLILIFFSRGNSALFLVGAGLLCMLATLGLYLLMANDPGSNISWWVDTGLSRMLLPGISLLWLGLWDKFLLFAAAGQIARPATSEV